MRVVPNQSMPRVRTLADQSDRGGDILVATLVGFLRRAFTRWFGVSRLAVPSSLLYTFVLVTVNTQSLSNQRLPFLSLEAQLILETTRGYCWRLVFLGL